MLNFDQIIRLIGKDVRADIQTELKGYTMTKLLADQDNLFKEWMHIVNILRKDDNLSLFRSNSSVARIGEFMTYL